jgi:hypothetical protein
LATNQKVGSSTLSGRTTSFPPENKTFPSITEFGYRPVILHSHCTFARDPPAGFSHRPAVAIVDESAARLKLASRFAASSVRKHRFATVGLYVSSHMRDSVNSAIQGATHPNQTLLVPMKPRASPSGFWLNKEHVGSSSRTELGQNSDSSSFHGRQHFGGPMPPTSSQGGWWFRSPPPLPNTAFLLHSAAFLTTKDIQQQLT